MPVMCVYRAPGVTPEDYDNVRNYLNWAANPPHGGMAHFISFQNGEAVEIDIWETLEDFQDYYARYFRPAVRRFGVPIGEPEVFELHNVALAEAVQAHILPSSRPATLASLRERLRQLHPPLSDLELLPARDPSYRPHISRPH